MRSNRPAPYLRPESVCNREVVLRGARVLALPTPTPPQLTYVHISWSFANTYTLSHTPDGFLASRSQRLTGSQAQSRLYEGPDDTCSSSESTSTGSADEEDAITQVLDTPVL